MAKVVATSFTYEFNLEEIREFSLVLDAATKARDISTDTRQFAHEMLDLIPLELQDEKVRNA